MFSLGCGRGAIRNEQEIARAVAPINECLGEAAWGRATWNDVCKSFASAMPDVVPIIRNVDLPRRAVNTMFVEGIEPERIASYRQHYVTVDPWMNLVEATRHGQIRNTERYHPSASFRDSEFYNEWLSRQDNLKAATGIRIDIDPSNAIVVCLHYSVDAAPSLDGEATEVLNKLKPALIDAVRSAAMLRSHLEQKSQLGSVIEHIQGNVLLVDARRYIHQVNVAATSEMDAGQIYGSVNNTLVLQDAIAQRWLEETIDQLLTKQGERTAVASFMTGEHVYRIRVMHTLDYGGAGFDLLVHPRPLILVNIKMLSGSSLQLDIGALQLAYGLTKAEIRLCETLANGYSLIESAHLLNITEGTVRQRTKSVFHKTGTRRQGELIARVSHFAHG